MKVNSILINNERLIKLLDVNIDRLVINDNKRFSKGSINYLPLEILNHGKH